MMKTNSNFKPAEIFTNIHCPQCGETKELDSNMVTVGKVTRCYWTCRVCKKRFRDANDLEKEISTTKPKENAIAAFINSLSGIAFLICGLWLYSAFQQARLWEKQKYSGMDTFALCLMAFGAVELCVSLWLGTKKLRVWKDLQQEQSELK